MSFILSANDLLPAAVTIPAPLAPPGAPRTDTVNPKATQLVYVVENDRISSVITELIVKKNLFGGRVECFANGQLAFNRLTAARYAGANMPDLILLDLDMPLMDGWEFLDALASESLASSVRVFVLTSSINAEDKAKTAAYPEVQGFFTKPLDRAGVARMQLLLQQ